MALPYIDRAILCGHNQPRPAMLVWLAKEEGRTNIENSVMAAMSTIESHLRPARVIVADRPLSAEQGELTSLGKLRRDTIEANWWQFLSNSMQQC